MIKHILIAMDGSEHAFKAFDLSCDLSEKYGARLTLIYVVAETYIPEELHHFAEIEHLPDDAYTLHHRIVAEGIVANAKGLAQKKGVHKLETVIVDGHPANEILTYAKQQDIDTIIMGNRGLGRFEGLLQGSVSQQVNHLADCTCITVK